MATDRTNLEKLVPKQRAFVLGVAGGLHASEAARAAGYTQKNARCAATILLKHPRVVVALQDEIEMRRPLLQNDAAAERRVLARAMSILSEELDNESPFVRIAAVDAVARLLPRFRKAKKRGRPKSTAATRKDKTSKPAQRSRSAA